MGKERPLILVINDDGIHAPGILALCDAMKEFGELVVVAPDKPQSGMGMAITLNTTLRATKVKLAGDIMAYSCNGTPVDCTKLAMNKLVPRQPDLVVSGINHGANFSINVLYSGTMSAAIEGALEGIPSIGFSLLDHSLNADFEPSKKYVRLITKAVLNNGLTKGVCLNVNIPTLPENQIKGVKMCRQANANWEEDFDKRKDPMGKDYYWLSGVFKNYDEGTDTDIWALENNYVSIVPVQFDLTANKALEEMKTWQL